MFLVRNKKNNFQLHTLIWGPDQMFVRIANREDPDQVKKQSDLGLRCLSMYFWQATSV